MLVVSRIIIDWLEESRLGSITNINHVSGGCINQGARLETSSGKTFFLKTNMRAPEDMFQRESEGLLALMQPGTPRVPVPYLYDADFLLLEDLLPSSPRSDYWEEFGRRLAVLHQVTSDYFGFSHDNYIGSTFQPNPRMENGYLFYGQQRLWFQAQLARDRGLLNSDDVKAIRKLVKRLEEYIPKQPASLIHGDLWSGNVITDETGAPAMIDPAVYYGWAEAELAMTALFRAFPESFYHSYEDERSLEKGYRDRFPIYNLYHILNHLNLFGRSYYHQVHTILKRYS
jgi:protein-ribulosamine 3-kinase